MIAFGGWMAYDDAVKEPQRIADAKANRMRFDTAEINGKIKKVLTDITNVDAFIMESGQENPFLTSILFLGNDRGKDFNYVAKPGDSIIKHRYSGTLILITKNKTYYAHFYH